jgi:hypothetical protein
MKMVINFFIASPRIECFIQWLRTQLWCERIVPTEETTLYQV